MANVTFKVEGDLTEDDKEVMAVSLVCMVELFFSDEELADPDNERVARAYKRAKERVDERNICGGKIDELLHGSDVN